MKPLTNRQREVVRLLDTGLSCPQVARRLGISLNTVRRHVQDIANLLPATEDVPALRLIRRHARDLLDAA